MLVTALQVIIIQLRCTPSIVPHERRCLMARPKYSYLYFSSNEPFLSDSKNDNICRSERPRNVKVMLVVLVYILIQQTNIIAGKLRNSETRARRKW